MASSTGKIGANGGSHRLFDQFHLACARPISCFADCAPLHLSGAERNTNDNAGIGGKQPRWIHLLDEVLQHLFGNGEIGNDAVLHRPDRGNIAGSAPQHLLCSQPYLLDDFLAVGPPILAYCHHRGFIQDDALAANIDESIGRPQVYRHIG